MMALGDNLLALDDSNQLLVWRIGSYSEPEVGGPLGPLECWRWAGRRARALPACSAAGGRLRSARRRRLTCWRGRPPRPAPQARISFAAGFSARCFAHPDTYLNKVVVGSQQGRLQLWNYRAEALVHEFGGWCAAGGLCLLPWRALLLLAALSAAGAPGCAGWRWLLPPGRCALGAPLPRPGAGSVAGLTPRARALCRRGSPVRVISPSPALDVVGVGLADG
jgi:hypothetical protein